MEENKYQIALKTADWDIPIPVLPEKLAVSSPGKNDKAVVLGLGEVLILQAKGLRSVEWDSFFPANLAPYTAKAIPEPIAAVRSIQGVRDSRRPVRFSLIGTDLDINVDMGIEDFSYEERWGEAGDIYYSIKLTEWKSYAPRRLELPLKPGEPVVLAEPARAGARSSPKSYAVVMGDSLWAVARKCYGSGDDWKRVYEANRGTIGANPNLIYPGQVLTIP